MNKRLLTFAVLLLSLSIYLNSTKLKDYDKDDDDPKFDNGPVWIVQPKLPSDSTTMDDSTK